MTDAWMHGTRGPCAEGARRSGFRQRDVYETAKQVADTTGVDLEELVASAGYGDAVVSFEHVGGGVSVTQDLGLAEAYARTGSGTLSDLLTAAHEILGSEVPIDEFLAVWLAKYEPDAVIVEFLLDDTADVDGNEAEGTIDFAVADRTATTVIYLDKSHPDDERDWKDL